jgi:hypothetical protein
MFHRRAKTPPHRTLRYRTWLRPTGRSSFPKRDSQTNCIDKAQQVGHNGRKVVTRLGLVALLVTALIEGGYAQRLCGLEGPDEVPDVRSRAEAVNQNDPTVGISRSPLLVVKRVVCCSSCGGVR